ncbi:DNA-directed RNA polymerase III subunit RPC3 [Microplitis mediator]|uniref:DNA-directed RNA polymerase III subunit RPC3 n=1 Tax=Microplitis mediator TaxID=375433 RepID=UPI002554A6D1|nr:DNA-directed RNA polymerase III subunit RPC3 [Microplitis mediator]
MSYLCGKLCSAILLQHFGTIVETVGYCLFKNGPQPLPLIIKKSAFPKDKVKESLCILIKFGLVTHEKPEEGPIKYSLDVDKVLNILRYSRYMLFIKNCSGDESEIMFEEVLKQGYETASQVIVKAYKKIAQVSEEPSIEFLFEKFSLLVKNQFLIRNTVDSTSADKALSSIKNTDFDIPQLNLSALNKMIVGNKADPGDRNIYWRINFDRLIQDLRDEIIVNAVSRIIDDDAKELMRRLIYLMYMRTASWQATSNPIPLHEIRDEVRKLNIPRLSQYVDQYLQLLVEDSREFVKRVGDSGGGQYSVDMKEAMGQLAWATVENIVMEKFGSKAARIFRLVRHEKFIEEDKMKLLANMPEKETKELTYILLERNYLQMQEVKKTNAASAPTKAIFLFHINFNHVVRMVIEHCHHALYNTIQRRNHEIVTNKRMMDKNIRMQTLLSNLKEHGAPPEQIEQIENFMTPVEKSQLEKVGITIKTLGSAELYIEDTLFLLKMYLRYN